MNHHKAEEWPPRKPDARHTDNVPIYYIPVKEAAASIRAELKEEFPGVKFSVRVIRDHFRHRPVEQCDAIRIAWTDGPPEDCLAHFVRPLIGWIDGDTGIERNVQKDIMTQCYKQSLVAAFVFDRSYSDVAYLWAARQCAAKLVNCPPDRVSLSDSPARPRPWVIPELAFAMVDDSSKSDNLNNMTLKFLRGIDLRCSSIGGPDNMSDVKPIKPAGLLMVSNPKLRHGGFWEVDVRYASVKKTIAFNILREAEEKFGCKVTSRIDRGRRFAFERDTTALAFIDKLRTSPDFPAVDLEVKSDE